MGAAQILRELRHRILPADLDQDLIHVYGLSLITRVLWPAVHRGLCKVAVLQWTSFDRTECRVLLANALQRLLDLFILYDDLGMFRAQFLVSLDVDLGHDLEAGLKRQRFAFVNMKIGHARLRDRNHPELLGFLPEVTWDQSLHHIALQIFLKALADDRGRHVARAESGQPGHFLVFLNEDIRFAGDFIGGNLDRNLPLHAVFILGVDGL